MSILPELLHFCSPRHPPAHSQELRLSDDGRVESSSRSSFIPPQIKDYGLGIPACLANNFRDEWGYRFECGILSPEPKPAAIKTKCSQGVGMYSGSQSFDWE
jgi:hypothetical protein